MYIALVDLGRGCGGDTGHSRSEVTGCDIEGRGEGGGENRGRGNGGRDVAHGSGETNLDVENEGDLER